MAHTLLVVLLLGSVMTVLAEDGKKLPSVFIGDGSGVFAKKALESAAALTERTACELKFVCEDGDVRSVFVWSAEDSRACAIGLAPWALKVSVGGYVSGGERVELPELVEQLKAYDKSVRMTHSRPNVLVESVIGASGEDLVKLLDAMVQLREMWPIHVPRSVEESVSSLSDDSAVYGKSKPVSLRRQAERQPYEITLDHAPVGRPPRLPKE